MAESEKAVKYLQDAGYDMLNCDNGTYDAWYWAHPPIYMPENCNLLDVEHIRKFVGYSGCMRRADGSACSGRGSRRRQDRRRGIRPEVPR